MRMAYLTFHLVLDVLGLFGRLQRRDIVFLYDRLIDICSKLLSFWVVGLVCSYLFSESVVVVYFGLRVDFGCSYLVDLSAVLDLFLPSVFLSQYL